jgi:hypothetical protein
MECRWCRYGDTNGTSIYEALRKVRVAIVLMADDLLFAYSCPGTVDLAEFTDWYDNEHVPNQLATPGFGATARFRATDGAKPECLATYSRVGTAWTDHGTARQERGLKRHAAHETRIVPIPPELVKLLRSYQEVRHDPPTSGSSRPPGAGPSRTRPKGSGDRGRPPRRARPRGRAEDLRALHRRAGGWDWGGWNNCDRDQCDEWNQCDDWNKCDDENQCDEENQCDSGDPSSGDPSSSLGIGVFLPPSPI